MSPSVDFNFAQAIAAFQNNKLPDAERHFKEVLRQEPMHIAALNLLSVLLTRLKRYAEAERYIKSAVKLCPDSDATLYNYGLILKALKRPTEALERFSRAISINPTNAETWNNRGTVLNDLKRYDDAIADYNRALELQPNYPGAFCNLGKSLTELKHYDEALAAYGKALSLKSDLAEAWLGRGNVSFRLKRLADAFAAYDKAHKINPELSYAQGLRLHVKQQMCDWADLNTDAEHLLAAVRQGKTASAPFMLLGVASTPADQMQCARLHVADWYPAIPPIWQGERYAHDRIRVAYLSADLREHPVAYLAAGLFERHDRSRFEITAISLGPDEDSAIGRRLKQSFDRFISVETQSDREIAELIRHLEIDILVDLCGYTDGARPGILARRPAPIQVNYLGYAGTMGAGYVDYVLADQVTIPEDEFASFSERVVWLPDSYMVSDDHRHISETTPTRRDCGLSEEAFVFCCFNNAYKIAPDIFDIWMQLLRASEGSVLWLSEGNSDAAANLRREAQRRGVAAERLVFAPRAPAIGDHLARHRLADLFLDTLPYNAHATASDALWAGLPILTCLGSTFAGRVGASLLNAIGLAELVTGSLADYEAMALALAHDRPRLAALRDKLARNRATHPLFDTGNFTHHIEQAYVTMWERQQRGEPPAPFAVQPIANSK
jgi:protein O-GlcNAc transferase